MFRSLLMNNSHSIEYINRQSAGNSHAFGLYVSAHPSEGDRRFYDLRHKVSLALLHIDRYLEKRMLFGIYIDHVAETNAERRAFETMTEDICSGMFNKILLIDINVFHQDVILKDFMEKLVNEVVDLEYTDLEGNVFQPNLVPLNCLIGV